VTRPSGPDPAPTGATVVGSDADDVAFLDAPGMTTDVLFDRVDDVLAGMPAGAILTVYTDEPAAASAAPSWCASHDVDLLAVITHDDHDGTTLVLCRTRDGADDIAARPPMSSTAEPTKPPPDPRLPPKT
jgi:TusA-related sulfurtransferase